MKRSTKFFIAAAALNIVLSVWVVLTTFLRDVRLIDLVLFYATAFGAGATFSAVVVSLWKSNKNEESEMSDRR